MSENSGLIVRLRDCGMTRVRRGEGDCMVDAMVHGMLRPSFRRDG